MDTQSSSGPTLKTSTRICNRVFPPTGMFFMNDRSVLENFGPLKMFRDPLPNVNSAGRANADAS